VARIRRGRRKKKTSSRVGGLGSKARSRRSSSRVGSLGSKAGSRSRTTRRSGGSSFRPQRHRVRRPRYRRPSGYGYPRRYRARPCSSGGCFTVFIILAIIWLIYLAPSITINLDATLSLILPIAVVIALFIVAIGFIAKIVDDDDDGDSGQVKVIERETILVVCPYCGSKNEQGITTCANCDAEI
jgi:hypothetical protein